MNIDKNIPLPSSKLGRPSGGSKYEVLIKGDSLFVQDYKSAYNENIYIRVYFKRNKPNLTTTFRKEGEGGRIWIIEKPKN